VTPTALLILQMCATHAHDAPITYWAGDTVITPYYYYFGGTSRTEYDPGFEKCAEVVPNLQYQKDQEDAKAKAAKYKAEHADEIKKLQQAIDEAKKEQPAGIPTLPSGVISGPQGPVAITPIGR
jgi:hypothetical protein